MLVAARNARCLLSPYTTFFRVRKAGAPAMVDEAGSPLLERTTVDRVKDKPPPGSFEAVETASRAGEKELAVQGDLLHGVTALDALRREHLRASSFKDLTASSREECDHELDGELLYFVSQYG